MSLTSFCSVPLDDPSGLRGALARTRAAALEILLGRLRRGSRSKRQLGAIGAEECGPLLEGWLLTVMKAHNKDSELFEDISCWAPAQARHTEVDFPLRRGKEHLALEVKSQTRFSTRQLVGSMAARRLSGSRPPQDALAVNGSSPRASGRFFIPDSAATLQP